jgi:hypothetical protein
MARLSEQLKYFIAKKVSEDADWRGVEIILSGHEVRSRLALPSFAFSCAVAAHLSRMSTVCAY